ncbi:MAG TPA: hypothetical protein VJ841_00435 [Candidatus Saccharimonadales bacterium]|nr:hypothetical protein [Candidatus Saccharimonadales bacterium]
MILACTLSACGGEDIAKDFKGDVTALGYAPASTVSSEKEKVALSMDAVAFVQASSTPRTRSRASASASSGSSVNKATPTPTNSPRATSTPRTITVYELNTTVKYSGRKLSCMVELERRDDADVAVRKGDRDIQTFRADEVLGDDGVTREINDSDLRDAPPASEVAAYLMQHARQFHCA